MKTVVLSSASIVSGQFNDCYLEIKDGILDTFKQYRCRLRAFHATLFDLQPLFLYIDGLTVQNYYTNDPTKNLFACIDTSDWISATGDAWQGVFEPQYHSRDVTVSSNIIRVRLMGPYAQPAGIAANWTMVLQFEPL